MALYFFWGDDDFALMRAVQSLQSACLDPDWVSFNLDRIMPDQHESLTIALNQAMTPPFGQGQRFVWLVDTTITQRCSEDTLATLQRTLPTIPTTTTLLFSSRGKPDRRLKSTKLLSQYAEVREFSAVPPWKTDLLLRQAKAAAQEHQVKLTSAALDYLVDAVGSNTRQLHSELEKISLFAAAPGDLLDVQRYRPFGHR